ncbi:MAG TPA: peptide deformylase [Acidimicrobiales bacterium]|nr:peptide deformylase [Acidimicrobiales bacterium]
MTVRAIRTYGDPVLRRRAEEVVDFDASLRRLVADLSDTLTDAGGAGLAANQIGVAQRVFVYVRDAAVHHLVNPVLEVLPPPAGEDAEVVDVEGCLSIPGLAYELARPRRLVARGLDQHGEPVEVEGTERVARALAHETDHLDGVLFIDRLPPELRKRAKAEIREMLLAGEDVRVKPNPHPRMLG